MKKFFYLLSGLFLTSTLFGGCGGGGGGGVGGGAPATTTPKWTGTKQLGVAGATTVAVGVAADTNGNVYVTGSTTGAIDGVALSGSQDLFLTMYNSLGTKIRTRLLGITGKTTTANSIAVDASGNVYVVGTTNGSLPSGSLPANLVSGTQDLFLTKYNQAGVNLFTTQLGVTGSITVATSVTVDLSGNVYVAGYTNGSLPSNTRAGTQDYFLAQYSSSGVNQYTKQVGIAEANTAANSIAVDTNGNVYVVGDTYGSLDVISRIGVRDLFLTKYNSAGAKIGSSIQIGIAGLPTVATGVTVNASGDIFVTGYTFGGLSPNTVTGERDLFLIKYDPALGNMFTKQLGVASKITVANSVAVDQSGNAYVGGYTHGSLDGQTLSGTNSQDFFLTKYDATGTIVRTRQLGVAGKFTSANSIALDLNGNVYVTGSTTGGLDKNTLSGTKDFFITKYDSAGAKQ